YERARKRVQAISGFYKHLAAYILVNLFLLVVKAVNLDEGEKFFVVDTFKTAIFWGIGLAFHALGVFYNQVFFGKNWEDRKIRELMEKEKKHKWE
ncbi:MAG: 2TM domain-containing protein, partial [Flavobacterium sp.]